MTTTEIQRSIDWLTLREVIRMRSRAGVASVYLRVRPGSWRRDLREVFHQTEQRMRSSRALPPWRRRLALRRLEETMALAAADPSVRFVAGFAVLDGRRSNAVFALDMPGRSGAYVSREPRVMPLVQMLDRSARTGVVHQVGTCIDMFELDGGHLEHLARINPGGSTDAAINPDGAPLGTAMTICPDIAPVTQQLAEQRRWHSVLAFGPQGLADMLAEHVLIGTCVDAGRPLLGATHTQIRQRCLDVLTSVADDRAADMMERVLRKAPWEATVGLAATERVLGHGRVDVLLVSCPPESGAVDPHELERIIHAAVRSGAKVAAARGPIGQVLAGHGGMAAVLGD